jgi:hypothetical protein
MLHSVSFCPMVVLAFSAHSPMVELLLLLLLPLLLHLLLHLQLADASSLSHACHE